MSNHFFSTTQPLPLQKAICKLLIRFAPTQQLSGPHDARCAFRTLVAARYRTAILPEPRRRKRTTILARQRQCKENEHQEERDEGRCLETTIKAVLFARDSEDPH